jgi:hypothetical protein
MIHTGNTVRMLQVVAGVVASALLLWSTGFPTVFRSAEAASITNASDTLSDSDLGVRSNHTIRFTTPNGIGSGNTVIITFPTSPDNFALTNEATGLDFNDMDLTDDGAEQTLGTSNGAAQWGVATTTTTIVLTAPSGATTSSSSVMVLEIGTNATSGATGDTRIVNPDTVGSYEITIGGSMPDSGSVMVAIIDDVVVSASVDTTFDFSVAGVNNGLSVNGTTTSTTSSATAIGFGTLSSGVITTAAQDLTVTTNASNGFAITVYQDTNLMSSTGADIDGFIDGSYTDTPAPWQHPGADPIDEDTWGHWGLTSNDPDLFGSNLWVSPSTTPRTVWSHTSVVNASTTRVGYQADISALQEAGDDYTATLTYIATPTF